MLNILKLEPISNHCMTVGMEGTFCNTPSDNLLTKRKKGRLAANHNKSLDSGTPNKNVSTV